MHYNKHLHELANEFDELQQYLEEISGLHDKSQDARLNFSYNQDKTKVYLRLIPPKIGGRMLSVEEAFHLIKKEGLQNVNNSIVEDLINKRIFYKDVLLCEGRSPTKGKDAQIIYKFHAFEDEAEYDVIPGQVLLAKEGPEEGEPGLTVKGEIIPPLLGKDIDIKLGDGVGFDGRVVYAERFGKLLFEDNKNKLVVEKVYRIFSDLDESFSDVVDYPGRVIIYGSVKNRNIKAKSTINISKEVINSRIESEKDIFIQDKVVKSNLYSKNIYIKEAINSCIRGDYVEVERLIKGCEIYAKILKISAPQGIILESRLYIEELADTKILGQETHSQLIEISLKKQALLNFTSAYPPLKVYFVDKKFTTPTNTFYLKKPLKQKSMSFKDGKISISQYKHQLSSLVPPQKEKHLLIQNIKESKYPLSIIFRKSELNLKLAEKILACPKENISIKDLTDDFILVHKAGIFGPWEDEYKKDITFQDTREKEGLTRDGMFVFDNIEAGLFLSVFPPINNGKPIVLEDVLAEINKKNYKDIDLEVLEEAVNKASGLPVKVGPRQKMPDLDGRVIVEVLPDKTKASVVIIPPKPGGLKVSVEDVIYALKKNKVREGIKIDLIKKILEEDRVNVAVCVAEAIPPTKGNPARLEYKFRTQPIINLEEDEHGRIDFKKLNIIENVREGQLLVVKHAPTLGECGYLVNGEKIPPILGEDIKIPAGKNTRLSPDGNYLYADCDGHAVIRGGKISVEKIYKIDGDVGPQTGNIYFLGTVIIEGNVFRGYEVEATGDIHIKGVAECCYLSAGGSITVCGGIKGQNKASITAKESVISKYIELACVKAGKDVIVKKSILHSRIYADEGVYITDRGGCIIGGEVVANTIVEASQIGCELSTKTQIIVGAKASTREQINILNNFLKENKKLLDILEQELTYLINKKAAGSITRSQLKRITQLSIKKYKIIQDIERAEEHLEILKTHILKGKPPVISVIDNIYPGVELIFKDIVLPIKKLYNFVSFMYEHGEIKIRPFKKEAKKFSYIKTNNKAA